MKFWWLVLAGLCITAPVLAAEPNLRIDIEYRWLGWGDVQEHWRIERDARGVTTRVDAALPMNRRDGQYVTLPAASVSAFEAAIDAAPVTMAVAVDEVARRLDRAAITRLDPTMTRSPAPSCGFAQRQAWARKTLTEVELRKRVQQQLSPESGLWTDDYPTLSVAVRRKGHPPVAFVSTSQKALMLPWKQAPMGHSQSIDIGTLPAQWRPALSDAVIALLPPGERSRARFHPDWLQERLRLHLEMDALACR